MYDFTAIFEALGVLLGAVILYVIVPYIKSKTTEAQQDSINDWVRIAVAAAEQIYTGSGRGAEKKAHVLAFLSSKGITLDEASVDVMIEAAVLELNKGLF